MGHYFLDIQYISTAYLMEGIYWSACSRLSVGSSSKPSLLPSECRVYVLVGDVASLAGALTFLTGALLAGDLDGGSFVPAGRLAPSVPLDFIA